MAQVPNSLDIKRKKDAAGAAMRRKKKSHEKLGKTFEPTQAGVIPEDQWQNLPGKKGGKK